MIDLIHVSKEYDNVIEKDVKALENINMSFPETGLFVITGVSGCGKTTLFNIISGLDTPNIGGRVLIDGVRIDNEGEEVRDRIRSSKIELLYQDSNLFENMTVEENILLPLKIKKNDQDGQERVKEIADKLGIVDILEKKAGKLSFGEGQLTAIARALVTQPKIILADEPTEKLDLNNSQAVFEALKDAAKDCLVVVFTHDTYCAEKYADHLMKLTYGKLETQNNDNLGNTEGSETEGSSETSEDTDNSNSSETASSSKFSDDPSGRRIPFKDYFRFAKDNMKKNPLRCCFAVVIFSITALLILLICESMIRDDAASISKYLKNNDQKLYRVAKPVPRDYKDPHRDIYVDKVSTGRLFYKDLCEKVDKDRIITLHRRGEYITVGENGKEYNSCLFFAPSGSEKLFDIEGSFPKKENEIMISKAEGGFDSRKLIGKQIKLSIGEFTVCGVINKISGTDVQEYLTHYLCSYILVASDASKQGYYNPDIMNIYAHFLVDFDNSDSEEIVKPKYLVFAPVDDKLKLVKGRMPEADNEILLSLHSLKEHYYTLNDVHGTYRLFDLYDKKYSGAFWDSINLYDYIGNKYTVVGIVDDSESGYSIVDFFIRGELFKKLLNERKNYYDMDYYVISDDDMENDISSLVSGDYLIDDYKLYGMYSAIDQIDEMNRLAVFRIVIIGIISILLMIAYYSYSISDGKKTVGILRTLGVGRAATHRVFVVESACISLIAFLVAFIACIPVTHAINGYIRGRYYEDTAGLNLIVPRPVSVATAGCICILLFVVSGLISEAKNAKKMN